MSRITQELQPYRSFVFEYGTITLWGQTSQSVPLTQDFFTPLPRLLSGHCSLITPIPYLGTAEIADCRRPDADCRRKNAEHSFRVVLRSFCVFCDLVGDKIVAEFVLFPFRSPLLREYLLVSFPLGTEMFHFPRSARTTRYGGRCMGLPYRVAPFGNLRIEGCLTPPRSLSQLNHVLHRLLQSRHPPHALTQNFRKEV